MVYRKGAKVIEKRQIPKSELAHLRYKPAAVLNRHSNTSKKSKEYTLFIEITSHDDYYGDKIEQFLIPRRLTPGDKKALKKDYSEFIGKEKTVPLSKIQTPFKMVDVVYVR